MSTRLKGKEEQGEKSPKVSKKTKKEGEQSKKSGTSISNLVRRKGSKTEKDKKSDKKEAKEQKSSEKKEAKSSEKEAKDQKNSEKKEAKLRKTLEKESKGKLGSTSRSPPSQGSTSAHASPRTTPAHSSPKPPPKVEKKKGSNISKATPKSLGKPSLTPPKLGGEFLERLEGIERTKSSVDFRRSHSTSQVQKGMEKKNPISVEEAEWDEETQEKVSTAIRQATIEIGRDELAAFANAGEKIGLEIWRIEKMAPVRVPKKKFGRFHAGDSYICLNTTYKDGRSRTLHWDLHYWIGRKAPKDSATSAAIRSIQLNEKIGGQAVHYREMHGHESEKFLQLFNYKIKYLKGGVESALNHVTEEIYESRLLHLLGKKGIVRQVDTTGDSLNEGDVFVLDAGTDIFVWVGKEAGLVKQSKGLEIANMINSENKGKGVVSVLQGKDRDNNPLFWEHMGGKTDEIAPAEEALTDKEVAEEMAESVFLYKVMEVDGEMQAIPITESPLVREMLESNFTYILDCETEIFIWVGKKSDWESKASGIMLADDFLTMFERPSWTPVTRMLEGTETVLFKSKFSNWVELHPTRDFREIELRKQQAKIAATPSVQPKINVDLLHLRPEKDEFNPEKEFPGTEEDSGLVEIWVIDNKSHAAAVAEENFGEFLNGRSYIVLYSFTVKQSIRSVAYFLGGSRALPSDYIAYQTGLYEQLEEKMESEGGKPPIQIRHQMFSESEFFLSMFQGVMIIHEGDDPDVERLEKSLYAIWGTSPLDVRAVEVQIGANQLSSAGVFVLLTQTHTYKWMGSCSTEDSKTVADHLIQHLGEGRQHVAFLEGKETEEFWNEMGGKADYSIIKARPYGWPRLFQISEATGVVTAHEICSYSQADLDPVDVYLLDSYQELFIWTGSESSEKERKMARDIALEYVEKAKAFDGRTAGSIPITLVQCGEEPSSFTSCFHEWKLSEKSKDLVEDIEKRIREKREGLECDAAKPSPLMAEFLGQLNKKYNIDPTKEYMPEASSSQSSVESNGKVSGKVPSPLSSS